MSMINLTMKHGRGIDQAKAAMERASLDLKARFPLLVRRVDWGADRTQVRVEGVGFWVEMKVDEQDVHVSGDAPMLAGLLGGSVGEKVKQVIKASLDKALPGPKAP